MYQLDPFLGKHKIRNDKYDVILFKQLQLLTHKLEYHLLGNHLLENGFALFLVPIILMIIDFTSWQGVFYFLN